MLKYCVLVIFIIWDCALFRLLHIFFLMVLVSFVGVFGAYAAETPITVEDTLGGALPYTVRNTCDPEYMKVLENKAWMAAQRQITQNNNLIARPDSILALSCFDAWTMHLWYFGEGNFPGNPVESGGYWVHGDLAAVVLIAEGNTLADLLTRLLLGGLSSTYMGNFPERMIGDRAKDQAAVPAYSRIDSALEGAVSAASFGGCQRMNDVWNRAKCYDFATESPVYKTNHSGPNHDGFYLEDTDNPLYEHYVNHSDFRTEANQCPILAPIGGYDWPTAFDAAYPEPGAAGAMDAYEHFLGMVTGTTCAPPIKTGFIVVKGAHIYTDAVCPNPGCIFTAPGSVAGTGTCSN